MSNYKQELKHFAQKTKTRNKNYCEGPACGTAVHRTWNTCTPSGVPEDHSFEAVFWEDTPAILMGHLEGILGYWLQPQLWQAFKEWINTRGGYLFLHFSSFQMKTRKSLHPKCYVSIEYVFPLVTCLNVYSYIHLYSFCCSLSERQTSPRASEF